MKILILYAKVGNGHLKAAEAIKEELERRVKPGDEIYFIDGLEASGYVMNKLIIKGYSGMVKHIPELYESIYNRTDTQKLSMIDEVYKIVNKGLTIKLKKLLRKVSPDVIVSTHPFVTRMCTYLKRKGKTNAKVLTLVTDYSIHNMWVDSNEYIDKILVATDDMKKVCLNEYKIPNSKIVVSGMPVGSGFKKELNRSELLSYFGLKDKTTILFFAGGGLGLGESTCAFEKLVSCEEDIQIIVVSGRNEKQKIKLQGIAKKSDKDVLILGYTDKVPELMYIADVVMTKPGGMTTTECINSGTPMIIINPIPGQEEYNCSYFVNNGVALRYSEEEGIDGIINIIVSNKLRLKQMKEMCMYLRKKDAVQTIANEILKLNKEK